MKLDISIRVDRVLRRRRPNPSQSFLTRGWEAAGDRENICYGHPLLKKSDYIFILRERFPKKKGTTIICFFLVTNYPHKTKWKKFACPPGHLGCIISWQIQLRSHTQDFALCSPTAGLESTWVENRTVGTPRLFDSAS